MFILYYYLIHWSCELNIHMLDFGAIFILLQYSDIKWSKSLIVFLLKIPSTFSLVLWYISLLFNRADFFSSFLVEKFNYFSSKYYFFLIDLCEINYLLISDREVFSSFFFDEASPQIDILFYQNFFVELCFKLIFVTLCSFSLFSKD